MAAADADIYTSEEQRTLTLGGHVGFDSLPDQLVSKSVSQGFSFNVLCVGETGIGKSTLMNTLFSTTFEKEEASHYQNVVHLRSRAYDLRESNVALRLTIVDTVGFGDQVNKEESYKPIEDYIDNQFENFLQEELKIKRSLHDYSDTRIHVCLFFITPTGHSLKSLDLLTMKKLDTKAHLPFAVVGSSEEVKIENKLVRARQYPWGTVHVENESHCDFVKLREMLVRVNMEDLREQTHTRHYELYRRCRLETLGFRDTGPDGQTFSLQDTYMTKRRELLSELQHREEAMRQTFVSRVKDTEAELKERERELHERFELLKRRHQDEKRSLEERCQELEEEMISFSARKATAGTLQFHTLQSSLTLPVKKDKDKKNFFTLPSECSLTAGRSLN
ncbi:septin-8-A-like isoform X2 [Brachyhypopomus gauderio]|uniref:septin-8-A-like isoform X2 n=1 Tax=Brachyhypopomus gauderio TaxID=698409 RepID=UPI0040422F37